MSGGELGAGFGSSRWRVEAQEGLKDRSRPGAVMIREPRAARAGAGHQSLELCGGTDCWNRKESRALCRMRVRGRVN